MKEITMRMYSASDGDYLIPHIEAEADYLFDYMVTPFSGRRYDPVKIICKKGTSSVKELSFSLHQVENMQEDMGMGIFAGIYRVGTKLPVWQQKIDESFCYTSVLEFQLEETELPYGPYFILLGNVAKRGDKMPFVKDFAGCLRLDFAVLPNGESLKHPYLLDCAIRYISPEERKSGYQYPYPSYFMLAGNFPLYELELTLDSAPDSITDKFDLRIFNEGLYFVEEISDILHEQTERIAFAPPHGVPHGIGHYIIYHNDMPFMHLQSNRKAKKMDNLKAEPVQPDSVFGYVHQYQSLQLYGCRRMKEKILDLLNHSGGVAPECLCIICDATRSSDILYAFKKDFYYGMSSRHFYDSSYNQMIRESRDEKQRTEPVVWIWDLYKTSTSMWSKWADYIEKYFRRGTDKLIIQGNAEDTNLLFRLFKNLNRLVPKKYRWKTQPFTKMEKVYNAINRMSEDNGMPFFTEYEKIYRSICGHSKRKKDSE